MNNNFDIWFLLFGLLYFTNVNGKCGKDFCKRTQFMSINGYFFYGKVIAVYEEVPLKICVTHCRTYSECRSFNMKWINPSRTIGTCALLQEVTLTSTTTGAINDENYTYYCKFCCLLSLWPNVPALISVDA